MEQLCTVPCVGRFTIYKSSAVSKTDCKRTVGRFRHRWGGGGVILTENLGDVCC